MSRIVAVFFLLWTAVDLTNPSVCAIDQQPASGLAGTESTVLTTAGSSQTAPNGGAEDCFCCCHHVVSATVCVPIPQAELNQRVTLAPFEQVHGLRTRLYHPPQLV